MKRTHDLAVKTGSYTTPSGETKNRYENIGSVMVGDKGELLLIKRTFNPAGVPNPENRDSVLVYKFEVRDKQASTPAGGDDFDDDIPFNQVDWRVV